MQTPPRGARDVGNQRQVLIAGGAVGGVQFGAANASWANAMVEAHLLRKRAKKCDKGFHGIPRGSDGKVSFAPGGGMNNDQRAIAVATTALLLAALSGCSDSSDGVGSSQSGMTSSPASTAPTSDSEIASKSAADVIMTFYSVRNQLRTDPKQPLDLLATVATSTELSAQEKLFKDERRDGLRQTGDTKIAELKVQTVSLDNSDPKAGKVPTVQIDVCYDVSTVDLIDADGKSVVSATRPETGWIRYTVANYKWASDPTSAWRVASSEDLDRPPCASS